jgi:hypothetical protein
VRRLLLLLVLVAVAVGQAACSGASGPSSAPGPQCANGGAAHRAYLVVEHAGGATVYRCVGFSGSRATGADLLKASGLRYQAAATPFGERLCQLDGEPPASGQCPAGWVAFEQSGSRTWVRAQASFDAVSLGDGDALGWRYAPGDASPAPPPEPRRG